MKRPRLPRIQLRRPKLRRPVRRSRLRRAFRQENPNAEPTPAAPEPPRKRRGGDLWFRVSTRFRAAGYWLREKGQEGGRLAGAAWKWVADLWLQRSREGRIRIAAVAGVLVLYTFLKLAPITVIPCQISAVRECAPPDDAVALVPADALLYAHLTLDEDSTQFERADDAFERLSGLRTILAAELPGAVATPSGAELDVEEDVLPWAERELAFALLPGGGGASNPVVIAGVGDRERADEFLAKIAPAGAEPRSESQGEAPLSVYADGFAAAYVDQGLIFGEEPAVRAALDAGAGAISSLEDGEANASREQLPDARFAEVYLSREGVQRLLTGRAGAASQLETFVDYGATSGFAAAAVGEEDGVEVELVSELDPALAEKSPSLFSSLPAFEPSLADEAGARAIGFVGVGELGPTLGDLLGGGGKGAGGLAASLRSIASRLEKQVGVNPLQDLLPELGGQAALVAEPTDGIPFASLVVEDVNEGEASEALAALQKPLLASLARGGGRVPQVQESDQGGVTARSLQLSPTVNLSYAVFEGKLVISTDPAGIAQVRADDDTLAGSEIYDRATDRLPDRVSALVFLNLDELFGQVTRTDLVEDPFFANVSVLFENASSLGLAVNGESDRIRSQLFLALD